MADLLTGLSLIEGFSRVIPALLILILLFAILEHFKVFGEGKTFVNAIIALCAAALVLVSSKASTILAFMTPWFVVLIFFIIFMLIAFKAMGVKDSAIMGAMKDNRGIAWTIIFIGIGIGAIGLGNVMGQDLLESTQGVDYSQYTKNTDGTYTAPDGTKVDQLPAGGSYQSNFTKTLFHPKVLSFALMGLIAAFTVQFMTRKAT